MDRRDHAVPHSQEDPSRLSGQQRSRDRVDPRGLGDRFFQETSRQAALWVLSVHSQMDLVGPGLLGSLADLQSFQQILDHRAFP